MGNKMKLILGSASPRRKELLSYLELPFSVMASNVEEITDKTKPSEVVLDLAKIKAKDIRSKVKQENVVIISADTIVALGNEILGKPKDVKEAKDTLLKLSDKEHQVLTGVCISVGDEMYDFYVETKVKFKTINLSDLNHYLLTKDSLDKAGSYGIQGQAQLFIDSINGSYSNVVGLPVAELSDKLREIFKTEKLSEIF